LIFPKNLSEEEILIIAETSTNPETNTGTNIETRDLPRPSRSHSLALVGLLVVVAKNQLEI
jgi:hypothetical protein